MSELKTLIYLFIKNKHFVLYSNLFYVLLYVLHQISTATTAHGTIVGGLYTLLNDGTVAHDSTATLAACSAILVSDAPIFPWYAHISFLGKASLAVARQAASKCCIYYAP